MKKQEKSKTITFGEFKKLQFAVPKKLLEHQVGKYILIKGKDFMINEENLLRHILREKNLK